MSSFIGICGLAIPALLAAALIAIGWRKTAHRALFAAIGLLVLYGLQALTIGPIAEQFLMRWPPGSVEDASTLAAFDLLCAAVVACVVGGPILWRLLATLPAKIVTPEG